MKKVALCEFSLHGRSLRFNHSFDEVLSRCLDVDFDDTGSKKHLSAAKGEERGGIVLWGVMQGSFCGGSVRFGKEEVRERVLLSGW